MRISRQSDWAALSYNVRSLREHSEERRARKEPKPPKPPRRRLFSRSERRRFIVIWSWSFVFFVLLAALFL